MHAAVVFLGLDIILHAGGLRVFTQQRIVVGGAGCRHRAQPLAFDALGEQPGADQPVGFIGGLLQVELLDQRAEDVGQRLVERPGLLVVDQPGFALGHAVRQLVADHVDGDGETVEDLAVAVAEHHLLAVPEGVLVLLAVVHAANQRQPLVIQ